MSVLLLLFLTFYVHIHTILSTFVEVPLISNQVGLPIFSICGDYELMLDTGSEEVWLGDSACQNCYKTMSLCPFLGETKKKVNYFKGVVSGDETSLNTCFGMATVLCARKVNNMDNI